MNYGNFLVGTNSKASRAVSVSMAQALLNSAGGDSPEETGRLAVRSYDVSILRFSTSVFTYHPDEKSLSFFFDWVAAGLNKSEKLPVGIGYNGFIKDDAPPCPDLFSYFSLFEWHVASNLYCWRDIDGKFYNEHAVKFHHSSDEAKARDAHIEALKAFYDCLKVGLRS